MSKILFVVSATVLGAASSGPRKDYQVLAEALGATVIDYASVRNSAWARFLTRVVGVPIAQAWLAFKRRNAYEAILTDGEHIGIPLALMLKISRSRTPHVTVGHRITAAKKRLFFRVLKVQTHISRIALHARAQYDLGATLGIESDKLTLMPYQVDTDFWCPQPEPEERLICSAGLEFRDYPTLIGAVEGLDVAVVIGAASHWSKRRNTAAGVRQPDNVTVDSFDYLALRKLYARASIVVVPLDDTDFQAGVTTILEAMAMAKPVIVTHSQGQTDVVEDRRIITRGNLPRSRPSSLLRDLADAAGIDLGPTGFYVAPSDPVALRRAIVYLLEHPDERKRLGVSGRRAVEQLTRVDQYGSRLRKLVDEVRAERRPYRAGSPQALAGAVGE